MKTLIVVDEIHGDKVLTRVGRVSDSLGDHKKARMQVRAITNIPKNTKDEYVLRLYKNTGLHNPHDFKIPYTVNFNDLGVGKLVKPPHGGMRIGAGAPKKHREALKSKTFRLPLSVCAKIETQINQSEYISKLVANDDLAR